MEEKRVYAQKKIYTQGEELDLKGIEIILMTKNGTTTVLDPEDCEISGFDPNTRGEQTILIRYTNSDGKVFTTTFTVEVIEERFYTQKIEVTRKPDKTQYYVGEDFDPQGMEVKAHEKATPGNASREILLDTEALEYDYDFSQANSQSEVTVSYEGEDKEGNVKIFTATVKVKVEEEPKEELYYVSRIKIISKPGNCQSDNRNQMVSP